MVPSDYMIVLSGDVKMSKMIGQLPVLALKVTTNQLAVTLAPDSFALELMCGIRAVTRSNTEITNEPVEFASGRRFEQFAACPWTSEVV